jgi:hypothetical protein
MPIQKPFKYSIEEYSQDTREYLVESEHQLTRDEIVEVIGGACLHNHNTKVGVYVKDKGKAYVKHVDTIYGDDSQTIVFEADDSNNNRLTKLMEDN